MKKITDGVFQAMALGVFVIILHSAHMINIFHKILFQVPQISTTTILNITISAFSLAGVGTLLFLGIHTIMRNELKNTYVAKIHILFLSVIVAHVIFMFNIGYDLWYVGLTTLCKNTLRIVVCSGAAAISACVTLVGMAGVLRDQIIEKEE